MSLEPINIFSCRVDPRGVAKLLRNCGREVRVKGPDDDWEEIVVTFTKGGLLRKARVLTFGHHAEYYEADNWPQQVMGMQGYFSNFPETPLKRDIMRVIGTFRFGLSVPQDDLDIWSKDDRLELLYAVCEHLDGVIFTPSALRDARGRILLGHDGGYDADATLPQMPKIVTADAEDQSREEDDEEDWEPNPPTPERIARRALALTAVAARATLELDAPELDQPDMHRERLLAWVEGLEIGDELEPNEWKVLQRPVGTLDERSFINSMWRVEGLAVLAWALQLHPLPPDDQLVVPPELYSNMGLFDVEAGRSLLASPNLRDAEELQTMQAHLLMLHWRMRDFSLRPEPCDFVAMSRQCWFGTFDISKFRIINGDLAIGDAPISEAPEEAVQTVSSLAMERHLAINWIAGYSEVYSETDIST